jgi:hypothetical protein
VYSFAFISAAAIVFHRILCGFLVQISSLTKTVSRALLAAIPSSHSHCRKFLVCIARITASSVELMYLLKRFHCLMQCCRSPFPVPGTFLTPGSGSGRSFLRIPDPTYTVFFESLHTIYNFVKSMTKLTKFFLPIFCCCT